LRKGLRGRASATVAAVRERVARERDIGAGAQTARLLAVVLHLQIGDQIRSARTLLVEL